MRLRSRLASTVAGAAVASVGLVRRPGVPASAATNGIGISTKTPSVLRGETARVEGKVVGAREGTVVVIEQRQGGGTAEWGSGRQARTDARGSFLLDRKIKGKLTRGHRACVGPASSRRCSFRARVEVLPRTKGITGTQASPLVTAGAQITATGTADAALAGRTVTLEQYQARRVRWLPVTSYAPTMGGFDRGPATTTTASGAVVTEEYRRDNLQAGGPLNAFDVDITGAQTLRLLQTASTQPGSTDAPLWFANPIGSCAL